MRNRSSDGDSEAVRGLVVAGSDSVDMPGFGGPDAVGRAYRPVRVDTVGGTCDAGRMPAPHERRIPDAFVETAGPDRIWTERAGARRRAPQTDRKDLLGGRETAGDGCCRIRRNRDCAECSLSPPPADREKTVRFFDSEAGK